MTLQGLAHDTGVTAMDVAKRLLDFGMHPPTMYFPLIVHEALMFEPTETESPETLDEAAADFPRTRFVMCHFGNPWLMDAAAVVEKNENVAADLSGLLEGKFDIPEFLEEQSGYISTLKTWLAYIRDYDKLMFGTDWPLANYEDYIEITKQLIPEKYWETVFYQAAERIYHCNF